MPQPTDQPDPKEATEAKLCAYLEGELSLSERAEIEQHLAGNPQHRQLLVDLAKTRNWMKSIPSESIPTDIAEIFQGQVERSMLLDTDQGRTSSFNRWPQLVLVAAIALLTVGLGIVIVSMLRPPASSKMVSLSKAASPATTQSVAENNMEKPQVLASAAPAITPPPTTPPTTPLTTPPNTPTAAAPVVSTPPFNDAINSAKEKPGATPSVSMMAPSMAKNTSLEKTSVVSRDAADVSVGDVQAKLLAAGYLLPGDQQTVCFVVSSDSPATTAEQVRGFFTRHDLVLDRPITDQFAGGNNRALQGPSTLPVLIDAATTMPATAPVQQLYVSHGLTSLQLELLSASLATSSSSENFKRITLSQAPVTQPVGALSGAIAKGQMLSITIPQLVGPGIEKTNLVKVGDDGSISLPMIDPLPAAGLTTHELEQRIAGRYRDASLIPQATVKVEMPAQPTTAPSTQAATTMPTTQQALVDQGISVVILVEPGK